MLTTTITQIEGSDPERGFNYRFSRVKDTADGWTVIRWPSDHPQIPPVTETLTTSGWHRIISYRPYDWVIREQDFERAVAVK